MRTEKSDQEPHRCLTDSTDHLRAKEERIKTEGAACSGAGFEIAGDLPSEVEQAFLQQIREFEEQARDFRQVRLYDLLKKPHYAAIDELTDAEVEEGLAQLYGMLESVHVYLSTLSYQSPRTMYRFITEELFEVEVQEIIGLPISQLFVYEDFHPDHAHDIQARCMDFLTAFRDSEEGTLASCLAAESTLAGKGPFSREQMTGLLQGIREVISEFELFQYQVKSLAICWDEESKTGSATVWGEMEYHPGTREPSPGNNDGEFTFQLESAGQGWAITRITLPVPRL